VLALTMSVLPAIALAEKSEGQEGSNVAVTAEIQGASSTQRVGESRDQKEREDGLEATSSNQIGEDQNEEQEYGFGRMHLRLENATTSALSLEQLKQMMEVRKHELDDEEASTTPEDRDIVKNANPMRLAVHTLLASKELLGGIGGQVSEIAKHMNDSIATTTDAEAQIQSRGFLMHLLFGGDSAAANVIKEQVAQNQQRIDDLTKLLGEANVPVDIQATLTAQITALKEAQARLEALAQKEQSKWGLFSWRF